MTETIDAGKLTIDGGIVQTGTYTPTLTAATGVTSVGNAAVTFNRTNKSISMGGTFTLQPSTLTGQVAFYMAMPSFVISNFTTSSFGGVAHPGNIAVLAPPLNITYESGGVRVLFNGSNLAHTSNNTWAFSLTGNIA